LITLSIPPTRRVFDDTTPYLLQEIIAALRYIGSWRTLPCYCCETDTGWPKS